MSTFACTSSVGTGTTNMDATAPGASIVHLTVIRLPDCLGCPAYLDHVVSMTVTVTFRGYTIARIHVGVEGGAIQDVKRKAHGRPVAGLLRYPA